MKKYKTLFGILLILAGITNGCVTEFNAKLPTNEEQILFVDGNIIGDSIATFYVGKSVPLDSSLNTRENMVSDAKITLVGSNGYQSSPASYSGNGMYSLHIGTLDNNTEYGIQIEYAGDTYKSTPAKPLHTPEIDSVSWVQPDSMGTVFFRVSTHDTDTKEAKFYMWDYKEDWEITAYYYTTVFFDPVNNKFYQADPSNYYCWKKNASNSFLIGTTQSLKENSIINKQLYQYDPTDSRFSVLYSVIVNQKALSKDAYDYYLNKITLNENMGGLFTPQPSEVMGNISCITDPSKKVMGYIEIIKNITHKRIFVSATQIKRPPVGSDCITITNDSVNALLIENEMTLTDFYVWGWRPAGSMINMQNYPDVLPEEWSYEYCTDCVAAGGSKNKPDFWPNSDK